MWGLRFDHRINARIIHIIEKTPCGPFPTAVVTRGPQYPYVNMTGLLRRAGNSTDMCRERTVWRKREHGHVQARRGAWDRACPRGALPAPGSHISCLQNQEEYTSMAKPPGLWFWATASSADRHLPSRLCSSQRPPGGPPHRHMMHVFSRDWN